MWPFTKRFNCPACDRPGFGEWTTVTGDAESYSRCRYCGTRVKWTRTSQPLEKIREPTRDDLACQLRQAGVPEDRINIIAPADLATVFGNGVLFVVNIRGSSRRNMLNAIGEFVAADKFRGIPIYFTLIDEYNDELFCSPRNDVAMVRLGLTPPHRDGEAIFMARGKVIARVSPGDGDLLERLESGARNHLAMLDDERPKRSQEMGRAPP